MVRANFFQTLYAGPYSIYEGTKFIAIWLKWEFK